MRFCFQHNSKIVYLHCGKNNIKLVLFIFKKKNSNLVQISRSVNAPVYTDIIDLPDKQEFFENEI